MRLGIEKDEIGATAEYLKTTQGNSGYVYDAQKRGIQWPLPKEIKRERTS